MGHGWEIVEARLPVLVTVIQTANQPRPPAARRVMRLKRARVAAEIAAEVKNAMPDAAEEQLAAEIRRRVEALGNRACSSSSGTWTTSTPTWTAAAWPARRPRSSASRPSC